MDNQGQTDQGTTDGIDAKGPSWSGIEIFQKGWQDRGRRPANITAHQHQGHDQSQKSWRCFLSRAAKDDIEDHTVKETGYHGPQGQEPEIGGEGHKQNRQSKDHIGQG